MHPALIPSKSSTKANFRADNSRPGALCTQVVVIDGRRERREIAGRVEGLTKAAKPGTPDKHNQTPGKAIEEEIRPRSRPRIKAQAVKR
jgi:hypothetical protein